MYLNILSIKTLSMNKKKYFFAKVFSIILLLNLILISSWVNSQVSVNWQRTFNSSPNLVDYGREIKIDNNGNTFVCGHSFINSDGNFYVSGNRDIVTIKYSQSSTGVISNVLNASGYKLNQNYPNPFNPSTKITFSIPKAGLVKLKVFDVSGKEVAVLTNEFKNAGEHSVNFNTLLAKQGSSLISGTYFYTLEAGDFKVTKRMTLVK